MMATFNFLFKYKLSSKIGKMYIYTSTVFIFPLKGNILPFWRDYTLTKIKCRHNVVYNTQSNIAIDLESDLIKKQFWTM